MAKMCELTRNSSERVFHQCSTVSLVPALPATPDDLDVEYEEEERVPPWRRAVPRTPRQVTASSGRARARFHPMVFIRAGLLLALLLWIGVTQVLAWGNGVLDLLQYGNPRTYQTDAVVGQDDSAAHPNHFLALNLHGQTSEQAERFGLSS